MTKKQKPDLPSKAPKRTGKRGIGPKPDLAEENPAPTATVTPAHKPELLSDANKQRGKTSRLPGMEDPEIEELEDCAREYANLRDDRMAILESEVETKGTLLGLMKKHGKKIYKHDGVEVRVVAEEETVKVRLIKEKKD